MSNTRLYSVCLNRAVSKVLRVAARSVYQMRGLHSRLRSDFLRVDGHTKTDAKGGRLYATVSGSSRGDAVNANCRNRPVHTEAALRHPPSLSLFIPRLTAAEPLLFQSRRENEGARHVTPILSRARLFRHRLCGVDKRSMNQDPRRTCLRGSPPHPATTLSS